MARRLAALLLLLIAFALPAEVAGKAAATPPPAPDGIQYHALSPALVSNVQRWSRTCKARASRASCAARSSS